MVAISQTTFSDVFSSITNFVFWSNFIEVCSQGSNWQLDSVGSGNGLALNRQQTIIWTNADPIQWRFYAALGGNELTTPYGIQVNFTAFDVNQLQITLIS